MLLLSKLNKMETTDLHRHKCTETGTGMSEGWYIDGEYYSTQELADKKAQSLRKTPIDELHWYSDFKDLYDDCVEHGETDFCYWTTWHQDNFDLEEEGKAYDDDGNYYRFLNGKWIDSDNQTIADNLEFHDSGDGVSHEIWQDTRTKICYTIPIEIVRDFNDLDDKEKTYNDTKEL